MSDTIDGIIDLTIEVAGEKAKEHLESEAAIQFISILEKLVSLGLREAIVAAKTTTHSGKTIEFIDKT